MTRPALAILAAALLALGAGAGAAAPVAHANPSQESTFQDDDLLLYNTPTGMKNTLDTLRALGVQRVRVSLIWAVVAPDALSTQRPRFDATDPAAYPNGSWNRYDALLTAAQERGIAVNFDLMDPAPLWATGRMPRNGRQDIADVYNPSAAEFGQFVAAVGKRYSGSYTLPAAPAPAPAPPPQPPSSSGGNPLTQLLGPGQGPSSNPPPPPPPQPPGATLPRVDYWSIWNEPNQGGWLAPQWTTTGHGFVEAAPRLYRGLVDAAWSSLGATGHGADTILVGETAPKGLRVMGETRAMKPLTFIRALYCVDARLHPLRGAAASARGCPASPAAFAAAHPALFAASGWAHHPYELTFAPNVSPGDRDFVTIASLGRLTRTLDAIARAYHRRAGMPLYMTEFGYMTNPPNPIGVSPAQQAAYINQAEYIAYRNARVRSWSQFLLDDDKPLPGRNGVTSGYGATFQTGLSYLDGRHKPSFDAYRVAIFIPTPSIRRNRSLTVWGVVRNAPPTGAAGVQIQLARRGTGFRTLATLTTKARPAYLLGRVRLPASGMIRIAWRDPSTGLSEYSRSVAVSAR